MKRKALFLDRDGVVNKRIVGGYVTRWGLFEMLPGIIPFLQEASSEGYMTVLVTNQRGIARGLMTEGDLQLIHDRMNRELRESGGVEFDAIYYCPHGIDEGCDCRKPRPGMILRAAVDLNIELADSWMIGDSPSDIEAGKNGGVRTILVSDDCTDSNADRCVHSLEEAWRVVKTSTQAKST